MAGTTGTREDVSVGSRWVSRKTKRVAEIVGVNIRTVEFRYVVPLSERRRPGVHQQERWRFLSNFTKEA